MPNSFTAGRKIINAEELSGPRVYSTDLLPSNFEQNHAQESVKVAARALKIKIITKGIVTLNSRYLVSPLAIKLINAHPSFFGDSIIPAFQIGFRNIRDLIESTEDHEAAGIDHQLLDDHISILEQSVKKVMLWDPTGIGAKYKEALTNGLRNIRSPIRRELAAAGLSARDLELLVADIESIDSRESVNVRNYIASHPEGIREPLMRFATACYHVIGTGVVRCETGTDLSPLSQFRATDLVLTARDSDVEALSDEAIFLEAFMAFALDKIQASAIPAEIIDNMDFGTAHQISEALREQGFQQKYDEITASYVAALANKDPKAALEELDEGSVAGVASELAKTFQKEILLELPSYKPAIQQEAQDAFQGALYRVGADVLREAAASIAPGIGAIVAVADNAVRVADLGAKARSVREQEEAFFQAQRQKEEKIQSAISKLSCGREKKAKLLDAVAALCDIYGVAIARA
jgi:hypothetical protein